MKGFSQTIRCHRGRRALALRSPFGAAFLFALLSSVGGLSSLHADDWPGWRGPQRDGRSQEEGLLERWPAGGPPLVWQAKGIGQGFSSMAVVGEVIVTMGDVGGQERIIAVDARTGNSLWSTDNGPVFRNDMGDGPRGTPVVVDGQVYALGANGNLTVLDLETGRWAWTVNVLEKFGGHNIRWGLSESPLVVGNRVLVNAGGRRASIVALDTSSGAVIWTSQSDPAGYSSSVLADIGGSQQAIFFTGRRALGLSLADGELLWEYERVSNATANIATPIVHDGRVFLSSNYDTGCALLDLRQGGAKEVYFNRQMKNHHSSSVLVDGTLYGYSSAILTAMDFDTGKVLWKDRSVGKGSVIYADGHLYCLGERKEVGLVEASPAGYREKGRFKLPTAARSGGQPAWSHPALANGRLYLRDQDVLFSYDVRAKMGDAEAAP